HPAFEHRRATAGGDGQDPSRRQLPGADAPSLWSTRVTRCVVGVDGGGTKTACLVAALDGTVLGKATAGPSNYQTVGAEEAEAALAEAIAGAAADCNEGLEIRALCLAMAGVDRPDDHRVVEEIATRVMRLPSEHLTWRVVAG